MATEPTSGIGRTTIGAHMRISIVHAGRSVTCEVVSWRTTATVADVLVDRGYAPKDFAAITVDGHAGLSVPMQLGAHTSLSAAGLREGSTLSLEGRHPDTAALDPQPLRSPTPGWCVSVISGADAVAGIHLPHGVTRTIGRSPLADVTVNSRTASWLHCTIERVGAEIQISDAGSRNGTYVAETRVDRAGVAVSSTQVFWVGDAALTLGEVGTAPMATLPAVSRDPGCGTVPFNRPPRVRNDTATLKIPVPLPREVPEASSFSWVTTLLPLLAAGVLIMVLGDLRFALFALLSPVLALGTHAEQRRRRRQLLRTEETRWSAELGTFRARVEAAASAESTRRSVATPDPAVMLRRALAASPQLWQQRTDASDFLHLHLGIATLPWTPDLDIGPSSSVEAGAQAILDRTVLRDTALAADLGNAGVVGIVGDRDHALAVARSLTVQAASHCGPADLSVSVSCDSGREAAWGWAGWLPHTGVRDDPRGVRWLSGTVEDGNAMLRRLARAPQSGGALAHLTIIDSDSMLRGQDSPARGLLGRGRNSETGHHPLRGAAIGESASPPVSGIVVVSRETDLPASCTTVVSLTPDGRATVTDTRTAARVDGVVLGRVGQTDAEAAARALARFTDPDLPSAAGAIPRQVRLLELLCDGPPSSAAIQDRWSRACGLAVPIGRSSHDVVSVDLIADGPHGLVGGTTGSGKSEFLRTLVAGLAASHDPSRLNFILIDFKGGAAFAACERLPHTIGTITNLDAGLASRAVRALEAELQRRQRLFAGAGVESLPAYLATSPASPLPRIVLVIDEFAMLTQEFPDVLASLVSIAAVGRTLGVHLLLATQRPAGVVTEDILTNTNLRIALRVQSREDSSNVIGTSQAAEIPRQFPGRALIRRGADDLVPVQTALGTGIPQREDAAPVTVRAVNVFGEPIHESATPRESGSAPQPQTENELDHLIDTIIDAHRELGLGHPRPVWPPPLGDRVDLGNPGPGSLQPGGTTGAGPVAVVALADEPDLQRQIPVGWELTQGNLLLLGLPGSGTSTALLSIGVALAQEHAPGDLELLCLDAGGGRLSDIAALPHTSTWVGEGAGERRARLLRYLIGEVRRRQRVAGPWRRTVVLIDGLAALRDELQEPASLELWDGLLRAYTDGPEVGVSFAVSAARPRAVPTALEETTGQRWVFTLPDVSAYAALGIRGAAIPAAVPGRCVDSATLRQLHIATPAEPYSVRVQHIAERWAEHPALSDPVGSLPTVLTAGELAHTANLAGDPTRIPIGVREDSLEPAVLELYEGEHALIAGPPRSGRSSLLVGIAELVRLAVSEPGDDAGTRNSHANPGRTRVWGIAPRRSPLSTAPLDRFASSSADIEEMLAQLAGPLPNTEQVVLLVDDADRLSDHDAAFEEFLRAVSPQHHLVFAGRAAELRSRYLHWTTDARAARTGILLQPDTDLDGELFGVRLPRRAPVQITPGRGYLCVSGSGVLVQTMTAGTHGTEEVPNAGALR